MTIIAVATVTALVVFVGTFLVYSALGDRSRGLLYSREQKRNWDASVTPALGNWLTIANICGTLTSLATVLVFFVGNTSIFGWFVLASPITLLIGAVVTTKLSRKVCAIPRIKNLFTSSDQTSGVIAALFVDGSREGLLTARVVKFISLANIFGIIWLEFALFAKIFASSSGLEGLSAEVVTIALVAFGVLFFVFKFGIRGVVFIDLLHAPLIGISAVGLLIAAVLLFEGSPAAALSLDIGVLPASTCAIFVVHVLILNALIVLTTEGHWLRMWLFGEREQKLQMRGVSTTIAISLLLICVGFLGFKVTGIVGEAGIPALVQQFHALSPIAGALFWLGALGALFSTSDAQIYSALLVRQFDPQRNEFRQLSLDSINSLKIASLSAIAFALLYYLIRIYSIPFEKVVFLAIPMSINIFPALIGLIYNKKGVALLTIASCTLYLAISLVGWAQPERSFEFSLSAAGVPLLSALMIVFMPRREG